MNKLVEICASVMIPRGEGFYTACVDNVDYLVVKGRDFSSFDIIVSDSDIAICPQNNKNAKLLRGYIDYLNPVSRKGHPYTIGLGDRLGCAGEGHLKLMKGKKVFPVLAQQSIRELNLTGRTYDDVLSSAMWAVFNEGYTSGFGADGDHLKQPFEIEYAIACGYSMITLDCSEHIDNTIVKLSDNELKAKYEEISPEIREKYEKKYLGECDCGVSFDMRSLMQSVLIYSDAIEYTHEIYERFIKPNDIDFEMSIDETATPTSPENHYFLASELYSRGIECETLAPRFCGEFQKGIDYIGDVLEFEKEYRTHDEIARHFGYRLSVHSGSDKFSVFPIVRENSSCGVHVKTAGTNWLEALRVIAICEPSLLREIYIYAVENLPKAQVYYHIRSNKEDAPSIENISDSELRRLLDADDTRQILHITYGLILNEKKDGEYVFRDRLYDCLKRNRDSYSEGLIKHIGRHLALAFGE
ncbi:MAG: hypothetical protein GX633_07650 [Clostridiales bacterium]|nr:hypothetical protein [Clostridiales bacterium]